MIEEPSLIIPDYVFEVSWEVCNKVGGIHTVISTKVPAMLEEYGDNYILIGPDVWKETGKHPEFVENSEIYASWRETAKDEGLNIRVGSWKVPGNPTAILVDFTPFFTSKNEIFAHLWEEYKLDSISGQWDFIEPALFGYAAAKVIQSFYEFHLTAKDKIVIQYHEWMTGIGVLYSKEHVPQAGTVFTTHATILGRSLAGSGRHLYSEMSGADGENLARNYNITAKFSLEKISAREADCFTTVSEITSAECKNFLGKGPDVITTNGFDDASSPSGEKLAEKRHLSREKLLSISKALLGYELPEDILMLVNSGRYEFRNKGIDLYLEALGRLNKTSKTPILAFILVPANQSGPNKDLLARLQGSATGPVPNDRFLTHSLFEEIHDPVLRKINEIGLSNQADQMVKIIFVPAYLNERDGIFNMSYYDLLHGFDLSVFPSYYEPWGYTPLESAAFHIPTITTSLAGFGAWAKKVKTQGSDGILVIERNDYNDEQVIDELVSFISHFSQLSADAREKAGLDAYQVSQTALWKNFIKNYQEAYSIALEKVSKRFDLFKDKIQRSSYFLKDISRDQKPVWNKIFVEPAIPKKLDKLQQLAKNLWWTWNLEAEELFKSIDHELWKQVKDNPLYMLESLSRDQLKALEKNGHFLERLDKVYSKFESYMAEAARKPSELIAYFSMEFGLHDTIKIFSGGLGILAGDYLKEASDSNKNIIGVGLLYRYGYFKQSISIFGDQLAENTSQKFTQLPLIPLRNQDGDWVRISIALPGRNLYAKAWRLDVGRVPLYLLDTDIPENLPNDRTVTSQLYGGDWENRFKQELLLGVGGIRLLKELEIEADVFHCNEGHASFINLERLRFLVKEAGLSFPQAMEVVRSTSLFTTHTPVPAGHDSFGEDLLRTYISHYPERLNITWDQFMNLGKMKENDPSEKFSMSVLAAKLSQNVNGVSRIHGRVTRDMFRPMYDGFFAQELHIGYVTNGVHLPTWTGEHWKELYSKELGEQYMADQSNPVYWEKIRQVSEKSIWKLRNHYRKVMTDYLRKRLMDEMTERQENPKISIKMTDSLDENVLTIGFARRFATYKRAYLLFSNMERLSAILSNKERPVQIIYAGKAHPADKAGQDLIKRIIEVSKDPKFIGKIFFIENYDIELAKKLTQGVDVWLNTPTRPLEASGTSGEKAIMNGVLNLSVLDGWWAEGYRPNAGWAIPEARIYVNQQFQDELDAETIYDLLEEEIIPDFYNRSEGIPLKWVSEIKNSIAEIAPHYTMKRMLDDYFEKYYNRLFERSKAIRKDNYQLAKDIESWKSKVLQAWNGIEVKRLAVPDSTRRPLRLGDDFIAELEISLNGLSPDDLNLDILFVQKEMDEVKKLVFLEKMEMKGSENGVAQYSCRIPIERVGVYDYAFRLYPKNAWLAHKQDFNLIKWI